MTIRVSERTRDVVCKSLKVDRLVEVMNRCFGGFSTENDVSREKTELYAEKNRGSIRLNTGRFYTAGEYEERVKRIKSLKLP